MTEKFYPEYPVGRKQPGALLTPRQTQTLRIVRNWWDRCHYGPTFAELSELLGPIKVNGSVAKVEALVKKGLLRRARGVHRSINITQAGRDHLKEIEDVEET